MQQQHTLVGNIVHFGMLVLLPGALGAMAAACGDDGDQHPDSAPICVPACLADQICNPTTLTCEPRSTTGCFPPCGAGFSCNPTTLECEPGAQPSCPAPCPSGTQCNVATGQCEPIAPAGCDPPCATGTVCDPQTMTCVPDPATRAPRCAALRDCVRRGQDPLSAEACLGSVESDEEARSLYQQVLDCKTATFNAACQERCADRSEVYGLLRCDACAAQACRSQAVACQRHRCAAAAGCAEPDDARSYEIVLAYVETQGCGWTDTCDVVVKITASGGQTATSVEIESDTPVFLQKLLTVKPPDMSQLDVEVIDKNWLFSDKQLGLCSFTLTSEDISFGKLVGPCGAVPEVAFDLLPNVP